MANEFKVKNGLIVSGTITSTGVLTVDTDILTRSKLQISNGRLFELIGTSTALNIYDASAGASRIYITDSGNIGIGTNAPNSWAQLETTGTVAIGGILYIKSSQKIQGLTGFPGSAGNLSINPDGGNVGIGTTSPTKKLEVADSDIKVNGVTIGKGPGTISGNINHNISFGVNNFSSYSIANRAHIGIGYNAFQNITGGYYSIAIGGYAMDAVIDPDECIAIGLDAMGSATYPGYSVAIGNGSLFSDTEGYGNIAIGARSANYLNSAFGGYGENTVVGNSAAFALKNARETTVLGAGALWGSTSHTNLSRGNTAVGAYSGNSWVSGRDNIWLGYGANGFSNGSYNVIIGANVSSTAIDGAGTLNNSIVLADGQGNVRIFSNSVGNVGIGTISPSYKLDVAGSIRTQDGYIIGANGNADITIDGNIGSQLRYGTQKILLNSADAYIYTNNIARVFVNNAGNVGIGTTSPSFRLDVRTGGQGDIASFRGSAYPITFATAGSVGNYYGTQMMMAADAGSTQAAFRINTRYNSAAGSGVAFTIESSTNDQSYGQNPSDLTYSEKFRIAANGNVGIGTTDPGSYKLYVNGGQWGTLLRGGDLGTGSDVVRMIRADNAVAMLVRGDGNVGIGTSSPSEKLHISGAAIFDGGAGNSSTDSVVYITKSTNDDWGLYVNNAGLDYGMYTRTSPSANYAFAIHNGTTWTTRITGNGTVFLGEKNAIEGNSDSWLRLNNSNHYASGVYTPGVMRADGGFNINGSTVWYAGNDGSGSGLDADLLDGNHASVFATRQDGTRYTTNYNSILASGFYNGEGTPANAPNAYGQLIVAKGIDTGFQIAGGYSSNAMWFRGWGYGPEPDGFHPWRRVWHDGDFSSTNISNWNTAYGWGNHASQSYATTSYVTTQINNLINGAPGALDTLSELASALGNDASFATTVTNSIAGKMALYNGAGAPDFNTNTTNGIYRNQGGANAPVSGNHFTMFSAFQPDGNYGWQLAASANDSIYFRFKDANFNSWVQIASQSWVTSLGYATTSSLANYLPLAGGTLSGSITATRFQGVNSLVLNNYTIVNPSSNVFLYSQPNDRDAWIFLDSADTGSNWGIYHRQIDTTVGDIPANSIGFVGGGASVLQAYISLANGNAYFRGNLVVGGVITESSSLKLKENIETSEGNLEKVVNLRPVTYNKIGSQTTELGLIAEEVAEVYPEFVQYDENGEPVGVHYSRLTAALIGAVKELTNQVQELNKKING